ncbi:MAG: hypothetical protein AAF663_09595 [Planctomycetota bacterium]
MPHDTTPQDASPSPDQTRGDRRSGDDLFPVHDQLDRFTEGLRDYLFDCLRGRVASIPTEEHAVFSLLAELTPHYARQIGQLTSDPAAADRLSERELFKSVSIPAMLSECVQSIDTAEGHRRLRSYLDSLPYPHFEPCEDEPGLLIRIAENGERVKGSFIDGEFRPAG